MLIGTDCCELIGALSAARRKLEERDSGARRPCEDWLDATENELSGRRLLPSVNAGDPGPD